MLFVADIGNTNIAFGVFDGDELLFEARLATDVKRTSDQFALEIKGIADLKCLKLSDVEGAIISSVVPPLTGLIIEAVQLLTGVKAMVLGPGVKSGIHIKIDNPAQLGADLVAGAAGAIEKYSYPCLVIDLGTATKISVIDNNGSYRGCTISAGVGISLKALAGSAALLPSIDIQSNNCPSYGTNTVSSMQAGIILGTASMLDGLVERIEEQLGYSVNTILATGGYSESIIKYCRRKISYEPNLILHGLKAIYNRNC